MMDLKGKKNLAGKMGMSSPQPMNLSSAMNVNPLERLLQKSAGKSQGRSIAGVKRDKPSKMNGGMY